jgi:hypothetical protein
MTVWQSSVLVMVLAASMGIRAHEEGAYRPPPAPEQPIPFSHKQHATVVVNCADCH